METSINYGVEMLYPILYEYLLETYDLKAESILTTQSFIKSPIYNEEQVTLAVNQIFDKLNFHKDKIHLIIEISFIKISSIFFDYLKSYNLNQLLNQLSILLDLSIICVDLNKSHSTLPFVIINESFTTTPLTFFPSFFQIIENRCSKLNQNGNLIGSEQPGTYVITVFNRLLNHPKMMDDNFKFKLNQFLADSFTLGEPLLNNMNFKINAKYINGNTKIINNDVIYKCFWNMEKFFTNPFKYINDYTSGINPFILDAVVQDISLIFDKFREFDYQIFKEGKSPTSELEVKPSSNLRYNKYITKQYSQDFQMSDFETFNRQLNDPIFLKTVLSQIFIITGLVYSLNGKRKFEDIERLNIKEHKIKTTLPDKYVNFFYKVKREIPNHFRNTDLPFSFTIQTIRDHSDTIWYHWKLLKLPNHSQEELKDSEYLKESKNLTQISTFKPKYFNKMMSIKIYKIYKNKRILNKWEMKKVIKNENTKVHNWKSLRLKRNTNWFDLSRLDQDIDFNDLINI